MKLFLLFNDKANGLDLSFAGGVLPAQMSFARASAASRINGAGSFEECAANVLRFDYDASSQTLKGALIEPQATNLLANNTMQGAVCGTPGALPTNWGVGQGGLTFAVVGKGVANGVSYVDIAFSGTTTGLNFAVYFQNTSGRVAFGGSQAACLSSYVARIGGSSSNISSVKLGWDEFTSGGNYLTSIGGGISLGTSMARRYYTTTTSSTAASINPFLLFMTTVGAAINITVRIGLPQIEAGTAPTTPIQTTAGASMRSADSLSFSIPKGLSVLRYVFDDNSTQDVAVSAGAYTVPTSLNRPWIKRITSP